MPDTFLQLSLYPWADALWLPVVLLTLHARQRIIGVCFILAGMVMMRMQVELMEVINYPTGILNIWSGHVFDRGLITYTCFNLFYVLLAYISPGSFRSVFLAASISIFFMALFASTAMMAL